jgi:hypothetical protein
MDREMERPTPDIAIARSPANRMGKKIATAEAPSRPAREVLGGVTRTDGMKNHDFVKRSLLTVEESARSQIPECPI